MSDEVERLRAALAIIGTDCRITHMDYPPGTTCIDIREQASDPATRYGEEFRRRILANELLCGGCVAAAALAGEDVRVLVPLKSLKKELTS